jgi:hypothetical protein
MTNASKARVSRFFDAFIRSEAVQYVTSRNNSDFINCAERAARIADADYECAAETVRESIEDQREAFHAFLRDRRKRWSDLSRFQEAVEAEFDATEQWHQDHGTLDQEVK